MDETTAAAWAALLDEHDGGTAAVARWAADTVAAAMPDARVTVYRGWHGLGFRHPAAGYVCAVFPRADGVVLSFEHGVELGDPRLVGTGRTVRSLSLRAVGDPPTDVVGELVDRAVSLRA